MTSASPPDHPTHPASSCPGRPRRNWAVAVGVCVLALAAATAVFWIGRSLFDRRLSPAELAQAGGVLAGRSVLLISVDTLRADHVACYGYRGVRTPVIDGLAAAGVRFACAVSPVPLTLPSHATMLTGLNPPRHGVRNNGTFKLDAAFTTLAEVLAAKGYRTGAAVAAFVLDERFGLAQGFETYDDDLTVGDQPSRGTFRQRHAALTNRAAFRWLREHADERFFLFVHYFDPHWPYAPPSPYRERYRAVPYDGEIAYVDEQIGKLLAVLDETGARERTLIVLTSDHGESLGDHGELSHGIFIYDATQRVPLILAGPAPLPAGQVISYQVGVVDIMPTVLDLLGIERPPALDGVNVFARQPDLRPIYIESLGARLMHGCATLLGVRREDFKLILAPKPELYDLRKDPRETKNLYREGQEPAGELIEAFKTLVGGDIAGAALVRENLSLSEEDAEKLRALGYVVSVNRPVTTSAATSRAAQRDLPDPKDMIDRLNRSQRAQQLIAHGRFKRGIRMLEKHVELWPADITSLHRLAEGYRAVGRLEDALGTYEKVLAQTPRSIDAMAGAAWALLRLGHVDEAERRYRGILSLDPHSETALLGLGGVQMTQKRYDEALATFRRVAARTGSRKVADAYNNIAIVYRDLGKFDAAREALHKALRIDPGHVHAAELLAHLDQADGAGEQGIERLRESLRRTNDPDGFLALGRLLRQAGKVQEAEAALRKALTQRPSHAETHYELGRVALARKQGQTAETMFRRCIALDPKHVGARSQLGVLLATRGLARDATRWLSEAVELAPDSSDTHYNLGIILQGQGQVDRAMASFTRALELRPNNARAHFHLGQLAEARKQPARAATHYRKALAIKPDYPEARAVLDKLDAGGR